MCIALVGAFIKIVTLLKVQAVDIKSTIIGVFNVKKLFSKEAIFYI